MLAYQQATAQQPSLASAYYNMGLSLQALGQLDSAVAAFASASADVC
jgi:tetratricopeptide (TPR) repeat protein